MTRLLLTRPRVAAGALLTVAIAGGLGVLASPPPAGAHAILTGSDPFDGEILEEAPTEVTLEFNEAVTSPLSGVRVYDGAGERVDRGDVRRGATSDTLRVGLDSLGAGTYVVTWRAVSADGHPIRGALLFEVRGDGAPGADVDDELIAGLLAGGDEPGFEAAAWAARALGYAGILVAAGGALFLAIVHDGEAGERRRRLRIVRGAAVLGAAAIVTGVPVQAALGTGLGAAAMTDRDALREIVSGRFGASAGAGVLGLSLLLVAMRPARDRTNDGIAVAGGTVAVASLALVGHNVVSSPVWLTGAADVVHAAAAATWAGGLVLLIPTVRDRRRGDDADGAARIVARFSTLAGAAVLVLALAGSVLAWSEVRAVRALTSTDYGRALVAKLVVVAAIVAVAAFNRFRLVPALMRVGDAGSAAWRYLGRALRVETAGVAVVILLTAALVNMVPAKTEAGVVGVFSTYVGLGEERELNLVVDPNRVGLNELHLYLIDATGRPADFAEDVTVRLTMPAKDVGPIERTPERAGPGHWILTGRELALAGEWTIEVLARASEFESERAEVEVYVNP